MAFTNYPPAVGTDILDYGWGSQMVKALDECVAAGDNTIFPKTTSLWDANVIPAGGLTSTSLTDTSKVWAVFRSDLAAWIKRWTEWTQPEEDRHYPAQYDLVLCSLFADPWGWKYMLRIPILDQNWIDNGDGSFTSNKLTFNPIDTGVPWFPGLPYYTHYFIQRRGGPFVHERVPEWPNDLTLEWGNAIAATTTTITVDGTKRGWDPDAWKDKWVYYTTSGKVRCVQITGNDLDGSGNPRLNFAAVSTAPDASVFGILNANNLYWQPDHQPQVPDNEKSSTAVWPMHVWGRWSEAVESFISRHPDDSVGLGSKNFPSHNFTLHAISGDPSADLVFDMPGGPLAADIDLFTSAISEYDPADWCFTKDLYKTFRGWQTALMVLCPQFVPYRADKYDGYARRFINNMSYPVFMWMAQVNAGHGISEDLVYSNGTPVALNASLTLSEPIDSGQMPVLVRVTMEKRTNWTLVEDPPGTFTWTSATATTDIGQILMENEEAVWDGTKLTFTSAVLDPPFQNQDIWVTWGNTRLIPNEFRYFYDKDVFIPDPVTVPPPEGEPPAAVPPTEDDPGNWTRRPKSTELLDFENHGLADYPHTGGEYNPTMFGDGMLARYVGDNWDFPSTRIASGSGFSWMPPFYDRFYEGKSQAEAGSRNWDLVDLGTVSSADDPLQFADTNKHWWTGVLIGGAGEATHTGTPTSISTTTISDTTHASSRFWNGSTTGRWTGHWVMIWQPGAIGSGGTAGPLHQTKRPITAYDPSSQTLTFPTITGLSATYSYTDAGGSPATGATQYRIREPMWEKNRFQGAICQLTRADTSADLSGVITYSEDNRIRVDEWADSSGVVSYTPAPGDTYKIWRASTGTVWKWDALSESWVIPTGNDTRSGAPVPFHTAQWTIPPTYRRRYGKVMPRDYLGIKLHTELAKMRSALRMTQVRGITFIPNPSNEAEYNQGSWYHGGLSEGCSGYPDGDTEVVEEFRADTAHPFVFFGIGYCSSGSDVGCGFGNLSLGPGITGGTSNMRLRFPADGYWLNYATLNDSDDEPGTSGDITNIFDTFGDPVAFRAWKKWDQFSNSTSLSQTSARFGSFGDKTPSYSGDIPPNDGSTIQAQYYVMDSVLILDWGPYATYIGPAPL